MPVTGTTDWIASARAAVRALRAEKPPKSPAVIRKDLPVVPESQSGLRGLDQTQDLDEFETKGRIVDRYL